MPNNERSLVVRKKLAAEQKPNVRIIYAPIVINVNYNSEMGKLIDLLHELTVGSDKEESD